MGLCKALKKRSSKSLISFFSLFLLSVAQAEAAPTIGTITVNTNPVAQYNKFELTFPITTWATNLYDPAQIDVHAVFTGPTGTQYTINGFPYQDYIRSGNTGGQNLTPNGGIVWKVRFSPPTAGNWSYVLTAIDTGGTSTAPSASFQVSPSTKHGFLQVSKNDPHYFNYTDGTAFFPIGENMAWPDNNKNNNTYVYDAFLTKLAAQGGNAVRLWMSSWCFRVEWSDTGLGNYGNRQNQAWCLDYVMDKLDSLGMVANLALDYHGPWSSGGEWGNNPYNSALGGPLTAPDQIWSSAAAQAYTTRRWRYITARWGYSTALMSYEFYNEIENTDNYAAHMTTDIPTWHTTNSAIIKSLNPQVHPVSTSFGYYIANQAPTWASGLDFCMYHQYNAQDMAGGMAQPRTPQYHGYLNAPVFAGEFGTDWDWNNLNTMLAEDPTGWNIAEAAWGSLMCGNGGSGWTWWWDLIVDPKNQYNRWKGVSSFVAGEDLDKHGYVPQTGTPGNNGGQPLRTFYLLGNQKVLGWVQNSNHTWWNIYQGAPIVSVTGATQSITGLSSNGTWQVQWWDTVAGTLSQTANVNVSGGTANITIPTVDSNHADWAFKMMPSAPVTSSTWRVVAGGAAYTDSQGHAWAADENYSGGQLANTTNPIGGALPGSGDQTLYQTERYGNPFSYSFNVPAGPYQVTLKFAETHWTTAGQRVFNVSINGSTVLTNFDILSAAGGQNKAIDEVFNNIAPSGGLITITFGPASVDNAKVDSIQIIPQPATPTFTVTSTRTFTSTATKTNSPTSTYTSTNSPTRTVTFTSTPTRTMTPSATASSTPTASFTASWTRTSTATATSSFTSTFTATRTNTPEPTHTATPTATDSMTPTAPLTASPTASPTRTWTASFTDSATASSTQTFTSTSSWTSSATPTNTSTPTATSTNSSTATPTATYSATPTRTGTATFTWSSTPSYTFTSTFTNTRTVTPSATASLTATASATPTSTYSATRTASATPTRTFTATATATDSTTPTPSATLTASASPTPTPTRSPTPTLTPTKTATPAPSGCSGVPAWNGNFVHYGIGTKVTYNGELYQCLQAHNSQSDWYPPVVPALWQDLGPCSAAKTASVYPNPSTSSNVVNLAVPLTAPSDVTVSVYTTNFRKVAEKAYPQVAVGTDLSLELKGERGEGLANGLYYLFAQAQGKRWTVKLLVLH